MNNKAAKKEKLTWFARFLNVVETAGNRLPHPITMFALLAGAIVLLSGILSMLGVSATGEMIDSKTLEMSEQTIQVVSLLNREGLAYMLTHAVSNFTSFAPLGVVLVTMLGVGCAEGSGYLSALMKRAVSVTPAMIVTPMLVFLGVMSNVASDIGYVVLIPIGAVVFIAYGRHRLHCSNCSHCGAAEFFFTQSGNRKPDVWLPSDVRFDCIDWIFILPAFCSLRKSIWKIQK